MFGGATAPLPLKGGATAPLPLKGGACDMGTCGLQQGGGSGSGGYGFTLNNDMGKVYADVARAPCLNASGSVSGPSQQQGGDRSPLDLVSYPAGYDMARPYSTDSAHFLEPVRYDRMCAGGRDTRRKHRSRKHKSRKHKKQSRKH